ncbi:hypothetical protein ACJJTC_012896, partial [Scirpophaga incertulas]
MSKSTPEASSSRATETTPLVAKNVRPKYPRRQTWFTLRPENVYFCLILILSTTSSLAQRPWQRRRSVEKWRLRGAVDEADRAPDSWGDGWQRGVLALPRALTKTGWVGVPIIIAMCAVAAFSGKRLGDCWSIIEARDPQMRTRKRNPYAIIAHQALGKTWSVVVSMAVTVTLFGAAVVYLLLAAQIIEQIFRLLLPDHHVLLVVPHRWRRYHSAHAVWHAEGFL